MEHSGAHDVGNETRDHPRPFLEGFLVVCIGCLERLPHSFDDCLLGATSQLPAGEGDDGDQMQSMGTPPNPIRFLPLQLEDAPRLKRILDEIVHGFSEVVELVRTGTY